jgi:hypothetical protein
MGSSFDFLSSAINLLWPLLSIATFVICLKIQGAHKGTKGPSLMAIGSGMVMASSLINTVFRTMLMNGSMNIGPISSLFSITSLLSLVGQVLFLVGLYHFGMGQRHQMEGYDELLDDLPD